MTNDIYIPLSVREEHCWCGKPAARKVGEEIAHDDPFPRRHNLTSYICAYHYAQLMGPRGARDVGIAPLPTPEIKNPYPQGTQGYENWNNEVVVMVRKNRRDGNSTLITGRHSVPRALATGYTFADLKKKKNRPDFLTMAGVIAVGAFAGWGLARLMFMIVNLVAAALAALAA